MTRNREFLRWMNLARTSRSNPLESQRPNAPAEPSGGLPYRPQQRRSCSS